MDSTPMRFKVIIDVPDETIATYHEWTKEHEQNLPLDVLEKSQLEDLIQDMIEEQTSWDVETCKLVDEMDLDRLKEWFKGK